MRCRRLARPRLGRVRCRRQRPDHLAAAARGGRARGLCAGGAPCGGSGRGPGSPSGAVAVQAPRGAGARAGADAPRVQPGRRAPAARRQQPGRALHVPERGGQATDPLRRGQSGQPPCRVRVPLRARRWRVGVPLDRRKLRLCPVREPEPRGIAADRAHGLQRPGDARQARRLSPRRRDDILVRVSAQGKRRRAPARRGLRDLAIGLVLGWAAVTATSGSAATAEPATVAAASDLKFAVEAIAARFERETGNRLRLVFGSSGNFHAQILQGAPFHVFMSADEEFVLRLARAGRTVDDGRVYAIGRIAILVPHGSPLAADGELKDLAAALRDGRLRKFAIANPEHAPYGMRAREALQHAGLWEAMQGRLVLGENVSQAAQFATSGSAQGGLVALSLAMAPSAAALGRFAVVPENWHRPLVQRMVLIRGAPAGAQAFYAYMDRAPAREVMARFGFAPPAPR
ncbi:MAG: molybdate ABC transporter substrate-binding protein [Burkholderiales bacterium]|nr:molybdate ABC transporter substrate-binding protein [Burkholderiales bacterium]